MATVLDALVLGGGQAGLAAGYHLRRAGLQFAILEAGDVASGAWPRYYDSLRLFSPARYCGLPGLPFPGFPDRYPERDEVAAYLRTYAAHFALPVRAHSRVAQVERAGCGFAVATETGERHLARAVIAATGSFGRPHMPVFPGRSAFRGRILHAADYRAPGSFRGQRVVVVGAGNSAVQIAVEVARAARVTLASRVPARLVPQRPLGHDLHAWARLLPVERLPLGAWLPLREPNVVLDGGPYRRALAAGRPERRPLFAGLTPEGVRWTDGDREPVDAIILATGYRPDMGYLAGLGALDGAARRRQRAGVSTAVRGLYFVGLPAQRTPVSATLRGVGPDAAHVVAHLRRAPR